MSIWSLLILAVLTLQKTPPGPLTPPENRRAEQTSVGEVTLTWQAQSGVRMYRVLVDEGRGVKPLDTIPGTSTRYVWRTPPGAKEQPTGKTLTFWIEPADPSGKETGTRGVFNPVKLEPLRPPDNRRAVQTGRDEVTLSWDARSGVPMYRILFNDGRDAKLLGTIGGNGTHYVVRLMARMKVEAGSSVTFLIQPADRRGAEAGDSAPFNPVTIEDVPKRPMEAPRRVTAKLTGDTITVTWDAVEKATGYAILRDSGRNGFQPVCGMCPPETTFVDRDFARGRKHRYAVSTIGLQMRSRPTISEAVDTSDLLRAEGPGGRGGGVTPPAGRGVTPPGGRGVTPPGAAGKVPDPDVVDDVSPPTNLKATLNGTTVQLSWTAPAGVRGYQIRRNGRVVANRGRTATSWSEAVGHMAGQQLRYEIVALGDGPPSTPAAFTPVTVPKATIPKQ